MALVKAFTELGAANVCVWEGRSADGMRWWP